MLPRYLSVLQSTGALSDTPLVVPKIFNIVSQIVASIDTTKNGKFDEIAKELENIVIRPNYDLVTEDASETSRVVGLCMLAAFTQSDDNAKYFWSHVVLPYFGGSAETTQELIGRPRAHGYPGDGFEYVVSVIIGRFPNSALPLAKQYFSDPTTLTHISGVCLAALMLENAEPGIPFVSFLSEAALVALKTMPKSYVGVLTSDSVMCALLHKVLRKCIEIHPPVVATVWGTIVSMYQMDNSPYFVEILTALCGCFDSLFATLTHDKDLRRNPLLWAMIKKALNTLPVDGADKDQYTTIEQKRGVYLLKRIIDLTDVEQHKDTVVFDSTCFTWNPKASKKTWDMFLTSFEMLNEFGLHLIQPVLLEMDELSQNGLELTWLQCFYVKAINHVNVGAKRMVLTSYFQSKQLPLYLREFPLELSCCQVLKSLYEVKLFTEHDRVLFDTHWVVKKGQAREVVPLPAGLQSFVYSFTHYFVQLGKVYVDRNQTEVFLETCVEVLLDPTWSRAGLAAILRVLLVLADSLNPDGTNMLLTPKLISNFKTVVTTNVNDRHPRWFEVRLVVSLFQLTVTLAGADWAAVVGVAGVSELIGFYGHGGATGGAGMCSVDVSGFSGNSGSTFTPYCTAALQQDVKWSNATKSAVRGFLQEGLKSFVAGDVVTESSIHIEVRTLLALLPAVINDDEIKSFLRTFFAEYGLMGSHTAVSWKQKLRRLVVLQEVLYQVGPEVGSAILNTTTVTELISYELQTIQDAFTNAPKNIDNAQHSCWDVQFVVGFDIVCGSLYAMLLSFPQVLPSMMERILQTAFHVLEVWAPLLQNPQATTGAQKATLIVARNALRFVQTLATLEISNVPAMTSMKTSDKERLLRLLLKLPHLRLESDDTPSLLTNETWAVVLSQYGRYIMNIITLLLGLLKTSAPSNAAVYMKECLRYLDDRSDGASHHNVACFVDLYLQCMECMTEDETTRCIAAMRTMAGEINGREYYRTFSAIAALIASGAPDVVGTSLDVLDNIGGCNRIRYFLAIFLSARLAHNPKAEWAKLQEIIIHIAVKTNTVKYDGESDIAIATLEPQLSRVALDLCETELPGPQLDTVSRAVTTSALLHAARQSSEIALDAITAILKLNIHDPQLTKEPCMPNSDQHRNRIRSWQILSAMLPCVTEEMVPTIIPLYKKAISAPNMSSTRRFMDVYGIGLSLRSKAFSALILEGLQDMAMRPNTQGSYVTIASHALLHHPDDSWAWDTYIAKLLPHCTHFNYLIRLSSQVGLHTALTLRQKGKRFAAVKSITPELQAIYTFIDKNPECAKWRNKHFDYLLLDPVVVTSLKDLFCVQRKEADFWLMDSVPPSVFRSALYVERELKSVLGAHTPFEFWRVQQMYTIGHCDFMKNIVPAEFLEGRDRFVDVPKTGGSVEERDPEESGGNNNGEGVQRKSIPWWKSEFHNDLTTAAQLARQRHDIIVVASYVQNAINVAALCRCCEIFGVKQLVVSSKKIFTSSEFVATARSAEQWVPTIEVSSVDVHDFLDKKKHEGYAIVGVEQTSNSAQLETCSLPRKAVLILGAEGHGIPVSTIQRCDMCVEIAQFGVVRSLNVHVSCAIVLHNYVRQHAK